MIKRKLQKAAGLIRLPGSGLFTIFPWQPGGQNMIYSVNPQKTGRYPAIELIRILKDI
jgi:hypothetical protein